MTVALRLSAFVGRTAELARLHDALATRTHRPGLVVAGEAGLGKTRLLREFTGRVEAQGGLVIWGGCLESGADRLPFAPFVEALDRLHERYGNEPGLFEGPELAALVPALGPAPALAPERIRLFEAVRGVFERGPDPTLLVLEDIHWADRSSLELLSYLVRRLRHGHTLVVATLRSDEVVGSHPLAPIVGELVRSERAYRLELTPLTTEQLHEIVRGFSQDLRGDTVETIVMRSEGNPFFAEALTNALMAGSAAVSPTLRELLLLRVDQVGRSARTVLDLVAIAGRPVTVSLLEAAWDGDRAELGRGIAEATERGLLVEEDVSERLFLRHALVADALEARIAPDRRAQLHGVLGAIIRDHPDLAVPDAAGRAGELARHWIAAGRYGDALEASVRAAETAEAVPARAEALAHYERALALWPHVADAAAITGLEHPRLLCRAAGAASLGGAFRRAVEFETCAAAEAEAAGDRRNAGEHYAALSRYYASTGDLPASEAPARRALELVPEVPPSRERSLALRSIAVWQMNRGEQLAEALDLCRDALSHATAVCAPDAESITRTVHALVLWLLGHDDAASAELGRAAAAAIASGDPAVVSSAFRSRNFLLRESTSDPAVAWRALAETRSVLDRMDIAGGEFGLEDAELRILYQTGAWDEVIRRATRWLASEHDPTDDDAFLLGRGQVEIHRGFLDEGEADLRAALGVRSAYPREFVTDHLAAIHVALADVALIRSKPEVALRSVEDALDLLGGKEYVAPLTHVSAVAMRCAADLAETARRRRAPDVARHAREAGEAHRRRIESALAETLVRGMAAGPRVQAAARWGLAEASRLDGASDALLWADAASRLEAWCYPELVPYARFRLAEAHLASGRARDAATSALRAAHSGASALGMQPLLGEVAALGRRARIPLTPRAPAHVPAPYGLSSREREVLALLVDGHTNREIGGLLFISETTASVHVTHILNKLGVNSRGAAAALASREGLVGRMVECHAGSRSAP